MTFEPDVAETAVMSTAVTLVAAVTSCSCVPSPAALRSVIVNDVTPSKPIRFVDVPIAAASSVIAPVVRISAWSSSVWPTASGAWRWPACSRSAP